MRSDSLAHALRSAHDVASPDNTSTHNNQQYMVAHKAITTTLGHTLWPTTRSQQRSVIHGGPQRDHNNTQQYTVAQNVITTTLGPQLLQLTGLNGTTLL